MSRDIHIVSCHDCGLLQQISHMPEDGTVNAVSVMRPYANVSVLSPLKVLSIPLHWSLPRSYYLSLLMYIRLSRYALKAMKWPQPYLPA